jgi:hypothetical protein
MGSVLAAAEEEAEALLQILLLNLLEKLQVLKNVN